MYAVLIGHLFGARGVHKKKRHRASRIPTARGRKQPAPSYEVAESEKGQLEWKL
jgi:hypothetical protein